MFKYPCGVCTIGVTHKGILCTHQWYHFKCLDRSDKKFNKLPKTEIESWLCSNCNSDKEQTDAGQQYGWDPTQQASDAHYFNELNHYLCIINHYHSSVYNRYTDENLQCLNLPLNEYDDLSRLIKIVEANMMDNQFPGTDSNEEN